MNWLINKIILNKSFLHLELQFDKELQKVLPSGDVIFFKKT